MEDGYTPEHSQNRWVLLKTVNDKFTESVSIDEWMGEHEVLT